MAIESVDRGALLELAQAALFGHCGEPVAADLGIQLPQATWVIARDAILKPEWADLRQEVVGDMTSHLTVKHPRVFQGVWNKLVREAKQTVEPLVASAAARIPEAVRASILDDVRADLVMGVMERTYAAFGVPEFHRALWRVYVAGHLPCGWVGAIESGRPMVF